MYGMFVLISVPLHLVAAGDPGPGVAGLLLGAVQVGVAVLQVT